MGTPLIATTAAPKASLISRRRKGDWARTVVEFLAGAGLTPLEALQAATPNPAKFLSATDSLGTVTAGKLADLVLLDGDPLADIHNVLHIRAVVANGRYFDRATLDVLDPGGTKAGQAAHGGVATP